MLRINLLPAYVALARATRKLFIGFMFLLAGLVGGLLFWYFTVHGQIQPMSNMADEAAANKANIDAIDQQASAATASIAPIKGRLDFYTNVQKYNTAYLDLYHNIFLYTSPEVLYNSLSVNGTTMTIAGYTPSFSALGRYLLEMYKEPDVTMVVLQSTVPNDGDSSPNIPVNIGLPTGIVGHLPGYNVPVTSYTVLNGKITAVNQGGTAAAFGAGAAPGGPPQFTQSVPGLAGGSKFDLRHDGFPFSVVLTLKSALTPPSPPSASGSSATPGAPSTPGGPPPNGPGGA